jgi:hypothetical protein
MIISHTHKYLFVELPRTASTAISRELRDLYDGQPILRKHATYQDFLKVATPEEKTYFVFSGIRNPLDDAVSYYQKLKSDHKNKFTDPTKLRRRKGMVNYLDNRLFHFVRSTDADFATFFKRVYVVPYNTWASLSHNEFDFVIRFEHLQDDFATVLARIGIEQQRPLPVINQTGGKERIFVTYYTPDIIPRAKRVFGPYMQQWGYAFPPEWGTTTVPWWHQWEFQALNLVRNVYWRHLRARI